MFIPYKGPSGYVCFWPIADQITCCHARGSSPQSPRHHHGERRDQRREVQLDRHEPAHALLLVRRHLPTRFPVEHAAPADEEVIVGTIEMPAMSTNTMPIFA